MNRPLLFRLNRLFCHATAGERAAFLRAVLAEAFGLESRFPPDIPAAVRAKAMDLFASYPAAPEGTPNALTPEIFALAHEHFAAQRKAKGVFYTPWRVGDLLARETLVAILTRQAGVPEAQARALAEDGTFTLSDRRLAHFLAQLSVCDPSAGSGGLLLPFALRLAQVRRKLDPQAQTGALLADIFARNLYAADLDETALEILQLRAFLLLRRFTPETVSRSPVEHVWAGDALQTHGSVPLLREKWGRFDAVLANPPFVGQKNHAEIFRALKQDTFWKNKIAPKSDLLYLFFYLALDMLREGGCAGFITTPYFTTSAGAGQLRAVLEQQAAFVRLIDFGGAYLFAEAGQHTLLSVFCTGREKPACAVGAEPVKIPQAQLFSGKNKYLRITPPENNVQSVLLAQMAACPRTLADVAHISNGLMSGCDKISAAHLKKFPALAARKGEGVFVLSEAETRRLSLLPAEKAKLKPFFKNSDIGAFTAAETPRYYLIDIFYPNDRTLDWQLYPNLQAHLARFKPVLLARRQNNNGIDKELARGHYWFGSVRRKMNFDGEKILVPHRAATNKFAYSDSPWYASSDVYFISAPKDGVSLWYLLALFNSSPYKIWLTRRGKRKGNLLELYTAPLRELPVPQLSAGRREALEQLARTIYQRKKQHLPTDDLMRELDRLVYEIFGVSA